MKKRILSLILCLLLCVTLLPANVLASEAEAASEPEAEQSAEEENPAAPENGATEEEEPSTEEAEEADASSDAEPTGEEELPAVPEDEEDEEEEEPGEELPAAPAAAERIRVEFVLRPENAAVRVFLCGEEESEAAREADGSYLLAPGAYRYEVCCEDYLSVSGAFELSAETLPPVKLEVTLEPLAGQPADEAAPAAEEPEAPAPEEAAEAEEDPAEEPEETAGEPEEEPELQPKKLKKAPAMQTNGSGAVTINAANFPDANFRSYVKSSFDKDSDGSLSAAEISSVTSISCGSKSITSLEGVEHFTALRWLDAPNNSITSVNVSAHGSLQRLALNNNQLSSLNVSANTALTELSVSNNNLSSISVGSNTALTGLYVAGNSIGSINVSKNTALKYLDVTNCGLSTLNVSSNTALYSLECSKNSLSTLNVSANTALGNLRCDETNISTLNLSANTALKTLWCMDSNLSSLNLSANTQLTDLRVSGNSLTSLNVSANTLLQTLYCSDNALTALALGGNTAIKSLNCSGNGIKTLNVSACTAMTSLHCENNALTSLTLGSNSVLKYLYCNGNSLGSVNVSGCGNLVDAVKNGTKYDYNSLNQTEYSSSNGYVLVDKGVTVSTGATAKPTITSSPKSVTTAGGRNVKFTVAASGSNLKYQWQYRTSSSGSWTNSPATGNKTATLTVLANGTRNGYQYRCKVTNAGGSAWSSAATLTVNPFVKTQPSNVTAKVGANAKFTITAGGTNLKYQWQYRTSSSGSWTNSPATGNKTASLTVAVTAAKNGYQYRCKVTNGNGSVYSQAATLKVKPAITTQPASKTAAAGSTVKFTVAASGPNLKYQWQYRTSSTGSWNDSPAAGNKTATVSISATAAKNGYQYRCVVKNGNGTAWSNAATLTVK